MFDLIVLPQTRITPQTRVSYWLSQLVLLLVLVLLLLLLLLLVLQVTVDSDSHSGLVWSLLV